MLVMCRGCGARWTDPECWCLCANPGEPGYEDWVTLGAVAWWAPLREYPRWRRVLDRLLWRWRSRKWEQLGVTDALSGPMPPLPGPPDAPWARPDADVAGDLRAAMRAAEREADRSWPEED